MIAATELAGRTTWDSAAARLEDLGVHALSATELVGLILGGPEATASKKAAALLTASGCLQELGRLDQTQVERLGLTPARAARLVAAFELGRRSLLPREPRPQVNSDADVARLLAPVYQHRQVEYTGVLLLDARNRVVAQRLLAIGSLTQSLVDPRSVFRVALEARCAHLVVWHTHPSGEPTPSIEDIALTRRLIEAGRVVGIEVVDHVVLGEGRFASVRTLQPELFRAPLSR